MALSDEIQAKVDKEIEDFKKTLKPNEICSDIKKFNPDKHKFFDGDAYFENSQVKDLGNLTTIKGYADFKNSQVKDLGNLITIGGDTTFDKSKVIDLGYLTTIVGGADFQNSQVKDLGNLTTIGGYADFRNSKIDNLGNLTTIGGVIYANGNILTKEDIIAHLNKMNRVSVIKKGIYYINENKAFIYPKKQEINTFFAISKNNGIIFNDIGGISYFKPKTY